jgi:hypothetical protein
MLGELVLLQRHRFRSSLLAQDVIVARWIGPGMDWNPATKIWQLKSRYAVSSVGRAQQRKQSVELADTECPAVAKRPIARREISGEEP